jgi:hypothetical protein
MPGLFQLGHTKGSAFLSVRALARKATTNLNIRWNKRTYVFELVESDVPCSPSISRTAPQRRQPNRRRWSTRPACSPCSTRPRRFRCSSSSTRHGGAGGREPSATNRRSPTSGIMRFGSRNCSDSTRGYRGVPSHAPQQVGPGTPVPPQQLRDRAGNRVYHQSISDASGVLRPERRPRSMWPSPERRTGDATSFH